MNKYAKTDKSRSGWSLKSPLCKKYEIDYHALEKIFYCQYGVKVRWRCNAGSEIYA